jgi:hypothetical protein
MGNSTPEDTKMPQIIVMADAAAEDAQAPVMFRERVNVRDFESRHFADQLVERLSWAVGDADAVGDGTEQTTGSDRREDREPRAEIVH